MVMPTVVLEMMKLLLFVKVSYHEQCIILKKYTHTISYYNSTPKKLYQKCTIVILISNHIFFCFYFAKINAGCLITVAALSPECASPPLWMSDVQVV